MSGRLNRPLYLVRQWSEFMGRHLRTAGQADALPLVDHLHTLNTKKKISLMDA